MVSVEHQKENVPSDPWVSAGRLLGAEHRHVLHGQADPPTNVVKATGKLLYLRSAARID
jgi:hypothetical protein